jgi:unconventional prefoldin RPB5 interactor 1
LELDEGATDDGEDDYEFEYTDEEEEDDDEDELGRSKHSVITPDYVKRMQELEKRLGVESAFATERPVPKNELNVEGLGRITVQTPSNRPPEVITEVTEITEAENKPKAKKGVRFAAELDVADESKTSTTLPERPAENRPEVNPVSDAITERPISDVITERPIKPVSSTPAAQPTMKPSRFKKDRATGAPVLPPTPLDAPVRFLDQERKIAPSGPDGKTVADAIAERDISTQPIEPDELDATLLHQEAAVEYHKMRNRLIQKQGGFAKEEEKAITPLDELEEEEGGGKKRMSRFKAARLQRQGL